MKVGFTTSFPVEVVLGAGHQAIDLNNIFVLNSPAELVASAEQNGFPRNICAWIKGMYSTISRYNIDAVVGIVQGDCSNTHSLMSVLEDKNIKIIPFSYPYKRNYKEMDYEICKLEEVFNTNRKRTLEAKAELDQIRRRLIELDRLSWEDNKISGNENHLYLVTSSDFNGDVSKYSSDLDHFLLSVKSREPFKQEMRLAYIGVPPILTDMYDFLETQNARVVFNEVQRQFSMFHLESDIVNQYLSFTYPYSVYERLEDIKTELKRRRIDGVISYTQSFCHRQIDHILLKKYLDCPVLQLEADQPGILDERSKIRIESFLEMIS